MKRKRPDGSRLAWLPEERDRLFNAAEAAGKLQLGLVLWTYETASRLTETLHARWEDIDLRERSVLVERLKRSEAETPLPLSTRLLKTLGKQRKGLIFPGATSCRDRAPRERNFKVAAEKCPGDHLSQSWGYGVFLKLGLSLDLHRSLCHPHAAKHTRLYDLAEELRTAGVPEHEILDRLRRLSGHKSYDSLIHYLRSREKEAKIMADLRGGLDRMYAKGRANESR